MQRVRIVDIVNPGTEEYLFLLLAADANGRPYGEIAPEDIENYLEENRDESGIFDEAMIGQLKQKIRGQMTLDQVQ